MPSRAVYLETFGCQMNELDSELVIGSLRSLGYRFVGSPDDADVVLYNTCSVRDLAEQKVRSRLGEDRLRKEARPGLVVGVLGCMAERDGTDLIRRMPVVDILCGPGELDRLPSLLDNAVRTRESFLADASPLTHDGLHRSAKQVALQGGASRRTATLAAAEDRLEFLDLSRAVSPLDHNGSAYVRITRGCNKFCSYCVVPHTRGAEVHRPPDHIVDECKRLADAGVIEVTLLGQTVNHYRFEHGAMVTVGGVAQPQKGRSFQGGHALDPMAGERVTTFADLLRRIHDEVPSIRRLRFVTSYPRDFGDDALEVIRHHPRICRYLHVPAQSGSDRMLRLMNRGYTVAEYEEFLARAREALHQPEIGRPLTIAGDMIVGFCSETEEDHEASKALLARAAYKNCFIFKYSPRPGTSAFDRLADDVPDEAKRRRNNELLAVQNASSRAVHASYVGAEVEVMVEGVSEKSRKRETLSRGDAGIIPVAIPGVVALTVGGKSANEATIAVADPSDGSDLTQWSARTEGDVIVHFDAPSSAMLTGTIVRLGVERSTDLSLFGIWKESGQCA